MKTFKEVLFLYSLIVYKVVTRGLVFFTAYKLLLQEQMQNLPNINFKFMVGISTIIMLFKVSKRKNPTDELKQKFSPEFVADKIVDPIWSISFCLLLYLVMKAF